MPSPFNDSGSGSDDGDDYDDVGYDAIGNKDEVSIHGTANPSNLSTSSVLPSVVFVFFVFCFVLFSR